MGRRRRHRTQVRIGQHPAVAKRLRHRRKMNHRALHKPQLCPLRKRRMPTRKHRQNQLSLLVSLSTIVVPLLFKVFDSNCTTQRRRQELIRRTRIVCGNRIRIATQCRSRTYSRSTGTASATHSDHRRPHKGSDCAKFPSRRSHVACIVAHPSTRSMVHYRFVNDCSQPGSLVTDFPNARQHRKHASNAARGL